MASEIFYQLSGGASFDKKKHKKSKLPTSATTEPVASLAVGSKRKRDVAQPNDVDADASDDDRLDVEEEEEEDSDDTTSKAAVARRKRTKRAKTHAATDAARELATAERDTELRVQHRIHVEGTDPPSLLVDFSELTSDKFGTVAPQALVDNLRHELQFVQPTAIQMQAIPVLLSGRSVLACAPTGSGKTAAFAVPLLAALKALDTDEAGHFRALILSPTRELALQTYHIVMRLCNGLHHRVCFLSKANAPDAAKKFDILLSTPLRLSRLVASNEIDLSAVSHVILDEADKLFDFGFVEQIDEILAACKKDGLQCGMFSATMLPQVEDLARSILHDPIKIIIGQRNAATESIKQRLIFCGQEQGKLLAVRQLFQEGIRPPILIFVQSKDRAKELFHELVYDGINVDCITSDRTQKQRDASVRNFRLGKVWVLIATDLMARGMDFKGVRVVINYDFPPSVVQYIHRIGRTGRAGRSGEAITLYSKDDVDLLRSIAMVMKRSHMEVPEWISSLPKLTSKRRREMQVKPPKRAPIGAEHKGAKRRHKLQHAGNKKTNKTKTKSAVARGSREENGPHTQRG